MSQDAHAPVHTFSRVPVTSRLDGSELTIPVHEFRGNEPGPTLTVISALHGSEWFTTLMLHQFAEMLPASELRGTVILIPVANPMSLEHEVRMTPDRSDEPDLNRVWPGGSTWMAEQIASAITESVLSRTDYLIDFHGGPWGSALFANCYPADVPDANVLRKSLELAVAFGYPIVRGLHVMGSFPGPRSIEGYASGLKGIPSLAPNLGGLGFAAETEQQWVSEGVQGLVNIARYLGMLEGDPTLSDRYFHFVTRGHRVVPSVGGIIEPELGTDSIGEEVSAGTVLGRVRSPYSFEIIETLKAPVDGILFAAARQYAARPGDWAYFVADTNAAQSEWIDDFQGVSEVVDRILRAST